MARAASTRFGVNLIEEFREVAEQVSALLEKNGVGVKPFHSPTLPHYSSLSDVKQAESLSQLKVFYQTMLSAQEAEEGFQGQDRTLWYALKVFGFLPPSELFSKLNPEDVIEIYDLTGLQIWRNLNFLKICSYTLEEMHCIEWASRYDRDPVKLAECFQKVEMLLTGKTPDVFFANITDHIFSETESEKKFVLNASHNWMARLKDREGSFCAWIAFSKVDVIGQVQTKTEAAPKARPQLRIVPEVQL